MIIKKQKISTVEDWFKLAPPKDPKKQWVDGRSAKELAVFWHKFSSPHIPIEISKLLHQHQDFSKVIEWKGEPELQINFDEYDGPSNLDLVLTINDQYGKYLIGIEAKAGEPFSKSISKVVSNSLERLTHSNSNGVKRVEKLASSLFSKKGSKQTSIVNLKYQLLTGISGIIKLAEKEKCDRVIFLIQEFETDKTTKGKHKENKIDLNHFVCRITNGKFSKIENGELIGPFRIPGKPLFSESPELYIGKIYHNLRS